jgi:hypothetical protein
MRMTALILFVGSMSVVVAPASAAEPPTPGSLKCAGHPGWGTVSVRFSAADASSQAGTVDFALVGGNIPNCVSESVVIPDVPVERDDTGDFVVSFDACRSRARLSCGDVDSDEPQCKLTLIRPIAMSCTH